MEEDLKKLIAKTVRSSIQSFMTNFNKRLDDFTTNQDIINSKIQTSNENTVQNDQNMQFSSCGLYFVDELGSLRVIDGDSKAISGKINGKNERKIDDKSHVHEVFDEMPKMKKPKQEDFVQGYYNVFSSFISGMGLDEMCVVSLFICGLKLEVEKGVSWYKPKTLYDAYCLAKLQEHTNDLRKKNINPSLLCSSKTDDSKERVENNVGLRNLDVSWKDGVECEEIELRVSEMGDNSKCVSVLDDFCDEDVEKSSEIEINSSSMTVLDDNCKETESRVSGMDDENNKRVKSAVGCCGMFDKDDDEIN
ncbi:hypothetical protein Tco_0792798 [Tanacetum coccineum]